MSLGSSPCHRSDGGRARVTDAVAGALARAPTWSPTVEQLAARTGAPPDAVRDAIDELVDAGIVQRQGQLRARYRLRSLA